MKNFTWLFFIFACIHASISRAVLVVNQNQGADINVVFIKGDSKSPLITLGPRETIGHEVFFSIDNEQTISVIVSVIGTDTQIRYDISQIDAVIIVPIFNTGKAVVDVEPSLAAKLGNVVWIGANYLAAIATIPFGGIFGMHYGAQIGSQIGFKLAPHLVGHLTSNAYLVFNPVLPSLGIFTGTTGGWILGAAAGGLAAPLIYMTIWKGASVIYNHAIAPSNVAIVPPVDIDDEWVLVQLPSSSVAQEDEVIIQDSDSERSSDD